jgi:uncharacterized protein (TIGR01777 family)
VSTILVSGATGFIGTRLTQALRTDGHRVVRLVRPQSRSPGTDTIFWAPEAGSIDHPALAKLQPDAVINLAGEPIARRWTSARMRRIRESRVKGTRTLAAAIASLPRRPAVLVSGSAIGYYGAHRGDEILDEGSSPGSDYLAEVAIDWERATVAAADAGIRVVILRTGVVLGEDGGALGRLLLPFRLGVGGRIGSGRQWMSWISREDAVRAIRYALDTTRISGPVNLVAPTPVRNLEFTKTLGRVLSRPTVFPVPAFLLELIFGGMARNTILADQRVVPKRLAGIGFEFRHPHLAEALRVELRR